MLGSLLIPINVGKWWVSWAGWLGYEGPKSERFLPFDQAHDFMLEQGLQTAEQWREWCRAGNRPSNIPSAPYTFYKEKGWVSWAGWLGYQGAKSERFL